MYIPQVPFDGLRQVFPPVPALMLACLLYLPASMIFTYPLIKLTGALAGNLIPLSLAYIIVPLLSLDDSRLPTSVVD